MSDPAAQADLSAVALFPLPNVVLFPGAVLPLHIFEERYKAMTAAALAGSRQIAMALLRPGWEKNYHGRPLIEPVVCVGTIVSHEQLADGRYNFLLQGHTRARILRELDGQPYRVARLEPLREAHVAETGLGGERSRLKALIGDGPLGRTGIGRKFRELLASEVPTGYLADLLAFYFVEDVQKKQWLLSEGDVRRRIHQTIEALESALPVPAASVNRFFDQPSLN